MSKPSCEAVTELLTFTHQYLPMALRNMADYIEDEPTRIDPEPMIECSYDSDDDTYSVSITGRYKLDAKLT